MASRHSVPRRVAGAIGGAGKQFIVLPVSAARDFGGSAPGYTGDSGAGALLLLLVGAYLLLAYVTGRLQWLVSPIGDLFQTYDQSHAATPPATTNPAVNPPARYIPRGPAPLPSPGFVA